MKNIFRTIIALGLLYSCSPDDNSEAIRLASEFAENTMVSARVFTDSSGVVTLGDTRARYVINPSQIFRGRLNEHSGNIVWITIDSLHDPYLVPIYHLIISEENGELRILDTIRSDMRILEFNNGIIKAEIPTHLPVSPLYYCSECRDTVQYQWENGQLNLTGY